MVLTQRRCAHCGCKSIQGYRTYAIKDGEQRTMYHCSSCDRAFSETRNTPIAQLKTPISVTLIGSRALQQLHPGSIGIMGVAHIPLEQPDEISDPVPAR